MAKKRGKAKRRSRRKTGVSVLGITETVMLLNVASNAAFNTNAWQFLTSKGASGSDVITLQEIINPSSGTFYANPNRPGSESGASHYILGNIKKNWLGAAGMMIVIPLAFKFGKKLGSGAINRSNRLLKQAGVASTVKI